MLIFPRPRRYEFRDRGIWRRRAGGDLIAASWAGMIRCWKFSMALLPGVNLLVTTQPNGCQRMRSHKAQSLILPRCSKATSMKGKLDGG